MYLHILSRSMMLSIAAVEILELPEEFEDLVLLLRQTEKNKINYPLAFLS